MKKIFILITLSLILPCVLAANLEVEIESSKNVMIAGLNEPATFNLKIKNLGASDNFEFYNSQGFSMAPKGTIIIGGGQTKDIQLIIYPNEDVANRGYYNFQYTIRGQDTGETEKQLTLKILDLEKVFEVGSDQIDPESDSIKIYIQNKEDFNFEKINAKFSSEFFSFEEEFSLEPNQKKDFDVNLNKEDFRELTAGFYMLNAEITVGEQKAEIEGIINFVEKDIVTTTKKDYGLIVTTKIIEEKNEGNSLKKSETKIEKNIISRLFTTFSPEPDIVERDGLIIYYTWEREIKPGETLEIIVKTNWLFPFLIIFFIIAIVIMVKQYSATNLILRKKVSFVKTRGGEFALKVSIIVNAQKYVERIRVIDRIPALVKVHERFGGERPTRIDEKTKRIEWNFEKLEEGETRMLSYIIYSKVGIVGKFALPSAAAFYERTGKIEEAESNRAFFVAEQSKEELEE